MRMLLQARIWPLIFWGCLALGLLSACGDSELLAKPAPPPLAGDWYGTPGDVIPSLTCCLAC